MKFGDKKLYVAKKIGIEKDDYGNEISLYSDPKEYHFSYMPTSGQVDYQIYGALINNMFTSILPMIFLGKFNVGDAVYLIDGETQNIDELVAKDINDKYCSNANYRITVVQPQNIRLKVLFQRIKAGGKSNGEK